MCEALTRTEKVGQSSKREKGGSHEERITGTQPYNIKRGRGGVLGGCCLAARLLGCLLLTACNAHSAKQLSVWH